MNKFLMLIITLLVVSCGTRQPSGENLYLIVKNPPVPVDRPSN